MVVVFILLRRRQPKQILAYKTENGNVTISRSAIIELVHTSCQQISQISKPKLKVSFNRGRTHFTVRIQLNGGNLKEVEGPLQSHLRESLSENLGIENLGDINIIVTSFKSGKVRSTANTSQTANTITTYAPPFQTEDDDSEDSETDDESEKYQQ